MSTKPNPLRDAMMGVQTPPTIVTPMPASSAQTAPTRSPLPPSRQGLRSIGGHFTPETLRQLRLLAAEQDRTIQELLGEALNDLFRKHNKSAIA